MLTFQSAATVSCVCTGALLKRRISSVTPNHVPPHYSHTVVFLQLRRGPCGAIMSAFCLLELLVDLSPQRAVLNVAQ